MFVFVWSFLFRCTVFSQRIFIVNGGHLRQYKLDLVLHRKLVFESVVYCPSKHLMYQKTALFVAGYRKLLYACDNYVNLVDPRIMSLGYTNRQLLEPS